MIGSMTIHGAIHMTHITVVGWMSLERAAGQAVELSCSGSFEMASVVDREQSGHGVVGSTGQRSFIDGGSVACNVAVTDRQVLT